MVSWQQSLEKKFPIETNIECPNCGTFLRKLPHGHKTNANYICTNWDCDHPFWKEKE